MASLIQLGDNDPTMMKGFEKLICSAYCPASSEIQSLIDARYFLFKKHVGDTA